MKCNYHTHSTWCDGKNTLDEMVRAAIEKGFDELGFSSHSDMLSDAAAYRAEVRAIAEKYRGKIMVRCGLEAELAKPYERGDYDYVIGSVHYLTAPDGAFVSVDHSPRVTEEAIARHFGGDAKAYVKAYFAAVRSSLAFDFDVVGHPDLIRKFNAGNPAFDEQSGWYCDEVEATAEAIAASGKIVEVNTGAISRGWMDDAYPSPGFRTLLRNRGVRFILSSDAHAADALDCAFDRFSKAEDFVRLF